jgi:transposase
MIVLGIIGQGRTIVHYYNAIQAAKYIGVDPKTVRRWLKKGLLTAERTEQGWLAIPGGQVEYAKIKWEEEQAKFARPWLSKESSGDVSNASLDTLGREGLDIIGRVEALEQKVAELEALVVPRHPIPPSPTSDTIPQTKPPKRNIAPSPDLPDGAIGLSDFAAQYGISLSTASRWVRNGDIPTEQRQRAGRPQHFLTIEQQEQALEWMRKYGKLS